MSESAQHHRNPPFSKALPHPIYFRVADMPAHATYPQHSHPWGEFVYAFSGVMEIKLRDQHLLAPPQYGVWLPPALEHRGLNRQAAVHGSLYIAEHLCAALPKTCCALVVSPLLRALLDHLRRHAALQSGSGAVHRLLQVLVDQLATAACAGSYLPMAQDPLLSPLLQALEANPGDTRSLAALARSRHTTERTLMRRCKRELGMSLAEWRKRLRVVSAMPRLQAGDTVENIAHDLGYNSSSAFIAMFHRMTGATPDAYRKGSTLA